LHAGRKNERKHERMIEVKIQKRKKRTEKEKKGTVAYSLCKVILKIRMI
jgi:hypothetical protein